MLLQHHSIQHHPAQQDQGGQHHPAQQDQGGQHHPAQQDQDWLEEWARQVTGQRAGRIYQQQRGNLSLGISFI